MPPVIATLVGTIADGESLVVTGTGFGTKATAAPLKFDTFESGAIDATITGWDLVDCQTGVAADLPKYSNARLRTNSTRSCRHWFHGGNTSSNLELNTFGTIQTIYLDYWVYLSQISGGGLPGIYKQTRWYGTGGNDPNTQLSFALSLVFEQNGNYGPSEPPYYSHNDGYYIDGGDGYGGWERWRHVQIECVWDSVAGPGKGNGTANVFIDGDNIVPAHKRSTWTFQGNPTEGTLVPGWTRMLVGNYSQNVVNGHYTYFDDVYFDKSRARVEVGNSAVYADCTLREIVPLTAHSATSLTVTLRKGAFTSYTGLYFFVVDHLGVASSGFPLSSVTEPEPPGGGASKTDNFNRASLGANWTLANGVLATTGSQYLIGASAGEHNWAVWNADTFVADHFSQVKLQNLFTAEGQAGVIARALSTGRTAYTLQSHSSDGVGAWRMYRATGGSYSFLASGATGAGPGDTLKITVEGTGATVTVTAYGGAAGTTVLATNGGTNPYLDTGGGQLLTGRPGVAIYNNHATSLLDDWSGGDLGGGTGPPSPSPATFFPTGLDDMADIYRYATTITNSDTVAPPAHRALWVTTSGNLVITTEAGDATLAVAAGQVIPIACKRVKAASTAVVVALQ